MSLKKKVVKSTLWIFLFQGLDQSLGFIRLLILARLLSPTDFGLVGMSWLALQIITTFTETGIQQGIIHHTNPNNDYLNVSWTLLVLRGVGLYIIIFLLAPLSGIFFHNNDVILLIRILCIVLIIEGFSNIGIIFFKKNLEFKKQFIYDIAGSLTDFVITLILAFILRSFWAIIIGSISGFMMRLTFSYVLSSYRPKFKISRTIIKEISHYGKWITSSNILTFLYSQGDDLLVGRLLGTTSLGFYQLAYRISNMPATQVTHIISTVMFPAYAQLQKNLKKLSDAYLQTFQVTLFLSFFVGTAIILFAYDFVSIFIGTKWISIVPVMQILTIWGVMRSIAATTGPLWQALGKPHIMTRIQFIQVVILAIVIIPFTLIWKINGTAIAVIVAAIIPYIWDIILVSQAIACSVSKLILNIVYPLFISTISSILIVILKKTLPQTSLLHFFILGTAFTIMYLVITYITDKLFKLGLFKNVFHLMNSIPIINKFQKNTTNTEAL